METAKPPGVSSRSYCVSDAFNKISIIGMGYIGLPTAAILANQGIEVVGVDKNPKVVKTINQGQIHIVEPDLDTLVRKMVKAGKLRAAEQVEASQAFIIAVPTPLKSDNTPDMTFVESAARAIAPVLQKNNLVILESTSPVGGTESVANWLAEERPDLTFPHQAGDLADIHIAHCPERVLPGHILRELVGNARIVGGMTAKCSVRATALYKTFVKGECYTTDARTAEMAKLTENAFRDVNIAFANEISLICDQLDINVWNLIDLANHHPRVNILRPGPGVGGHCIAVDPWFLVHSSPEHSKLIHTARTVNDSKPQYIINKVKRIADSLKAPVIACMGLAFKADIDDLRESPSVKIVKQLAEADIGDILAVEPHIDALPEDFQNLKNVSLTGFEKALEQANIILLLVDHQVFSNVDPVALKEKIIIDTKGLWA
ncbi:MAG: UDP-N-acetyl-D-mannosamine dehydrogenase [Candidatus Nitrohelix vancouverensis]|uniref:UDP-N-acetyl-D-mannosamine dehydrogenase n=1 Tax=Candidatus Nitrohelix vancouverensis TaxID=2705534 RepID=A0A7T0C2K1_9BACT|nr:MAG: UDP-N-acetyl-D-mannosamine dehydrogenase [Candidatus Nitrohelix vancouverensis]